MSGLAVHQLRKGLFADTGFSFDSAYLQLRGDNFSLADESSCGITDGDEGVVWLGIGVIEGTGLSLRRYEILHQHVRNSTLRPEVTCAGSQWVYRLKEGEPEVSGQGRLTDGAESTQTSRWTCPSRKSAWIVRAIWALGQFSVYL